MSRLAKRPLVQYVRSGARFYLPFFYTYRVKKLNHSHIIKQLLFGQWAILAIAVGLSAPPYLLNTIWLLLLNISCAIIYEIGYWENDAIGEKYEAEPTLSRTYERYKDRLKLDTAAPWLWAMGIAVLTLFLKEITRGASQIGAATGAIETTVWPWPSLLWSASIWLCYLVAIRITFGVYNRIDERSRIWVYPVLQAQRLFGFALVLPLNTVGTLLLLSLVVSRWMNYTVYRCGGDRKLIAFHFPFLWVFTISFLAFLASSPTPTTLITWQSAIAFIYCGIKGVREASRLNISFSLLDTKD